MSGIEMVVTAYFCQFTTINGTIEYWTHHRKPKSNHTSYKPNTLVGPTVTRLLKYPLAVTGLQNRLNIPFPNPMLSGLQLKLKLFKYCMFRHMIQFKIKILDSSSKDTGSAPIWLKLACVCKTSENIFKTKLVYP